MIVIVDERELVINGYALMFNREGVATTGFCPTEFDSWFTAAPDPDLGSVEAFLLGNCDGRSSLARIIKRRSSAAVIAMDDQKTLGETLDLFAAGVDDVVGKPVHVRELLARIGAIGRRAKASGGELEAGPIQVFSEGRDPEVGGLPLPLPRRELRILEYLVRNKGRRVTKAQIFNYVYGLFDREIDDNVVESHISKLRKRLRQRLDYDPIDSKRHLGYRLKVD